jgi:hypothetical protein
MLARKADKIELLGGDLQAVMQKLDGTGDLIWKVMGATGQPAVYVPITAQIVLDLADSGEIMDTTTFYRAEVLIGTIKQHPVPTMVDIHAGWPQVFGEPDPV